MWLLDNISLLERPLSSIIVVAKVEQRYYDKLGQRYDTGVITNFSQRDCNRIPRGSALLICDFDTRISRSEPYRVLRTGRNVVGG